MMLRLTSWTFPKNPSTVDDSLIDEDRRKKIAALKQAVADGTYHVTAEQLADKLIDHMLEPEP
jgi:anti-sigma28 factor (negative regulator of flagellin synthesis)